jgi:hypothetical protein
MAAAQSGHTACVQALVAAKAALDIKSVSYARLFACPVTLESPSPSKPHKHPLKPVSCAVVCVCVRTVVLLLSLVYVYSDDCVLILCLYAH